MLRIKVKEQGYIFCLLLLFTLSFNGQAKENSNEEKSKHDQYLKTSLKKNFFN